jgi:3-oxoacyl-[acyl-carrier-protein] synthase-1/3-oxoacyl-[acyl-carrier-protein] synthase II
MTAALIAFGALSALGEGSNAASAGTVGTSATVALGQDPELVTAGLARPFAGRVAGDPGDDDRATFILLRALAACLADLDSVLPAWRTRRVGLALGTSSGAMRSAELYFADPTQDSRITYGAPATEALRRLGLAPSPVVLVLCACASSTVAIGLGLRWLDQDECDVVLAGGFDAVSVFVAAGFEALRATTERLPPVPFRAGRDGMALGEGAAIVALVRPDDVTQAPLAYVTGFGASTDAVHLTAPDRSGSGLLRASQAAMREACCQDVDLVSAHGTATLFNDAAEAQAIATLLPHTQAVTHAFKAQVGHTLGASGVLESLVCVDALRRGVLPATAGDGPAEGAIRLLSQTQAGSPEAALKLSAAFGGANAALVLARSPSVAPRRAPCAAFVCRAVSVRTMPAVESLALRLRVPVDRLWQSDALCHWALAAVAALQDLLGMSLAAGVVVGSVFGPLETNALFHERLRSRGARRVEPRRFPYTSPNAVAGACAIAFGLTGPSFAVGLGQHAAVEALAAATWLVRAGDADRMVVVAVDDVGPVGSGLGSGGSSGAVALLVSSDTTCGARIGRIRLCQRLSGTAGPFGHMALLPLVEGSVTVRSWCPDARVFAEVEVDDRG